MNGPRRLGVLDKNTQRSSNKQRPEMRRKTRRRRYEQKGLVLASTNFPLLYSWENVTPSRYPTDMINGISTALQQLEVLLLLIFPVPFSIVLMLVLLLLSPG